LSVDSRHAASARSLNMVGGRCTIRCSPITPGWARFVPRGRERRPERLSEPRGASSAEPLDSGRGYLGLQMSACGFRGAFLWLGNICAHSWEAISVLDEIAFLVRNDPSLVCPSAIAGPSQMMQTRRTGGVGTAGLARDYERVSRPRSSGLRCRWRCSSQS
jgi:hypothetical protein